MARLPRMFTVCSTFLGRHRIALGLAGALVASVSGACSASLDFSECSKDSDCDRFDGAEPLRCESNTCVAATCSDNSTCASLGDDQLCGLDELCVDALEVDGCKWLVLPGGEINDSLTVIGAVYDASSAIGPLVRASFVLAVEDFNAGATLGNGNQVGLIGCDSGGDLDQAKDAATHLAENVGVPAILGPLEDDAFIHVAEKVSVKAGNLIFTMSPTAIAPSTFSDSNVVWRTIPGAAYHGQAIAQRIADAGYESAIMVFRGDNYGLGLYKALTVEVGGQQVIEGVSNQSHLSYSVDEDGSGQIETLLTGSPNPDVIVLLGGDEVGEQLKKIVALGVLPKRILISHAGLRGVQSAIIEVGDADFAGRIEMIAPLSAHPTNAPLLYERLQATSNVVLGAEAPLAYDAAMTTLLAMRAIDGGTAITGPTIAPRMSKLTAGSPISFGEIEGYKFVKAAADALGLGNSIDVIGTSGDLSFVPEFGQPCGPFVAWGFDDVAVPLPVLRSSFTVNCPDTTGSWSS